MALQQGDYEIRVVLLALSTRFCASCRQLSSLTLGSASKANDDVNLNLALSLEEIEHAFVLFVFWIKVCFIASGFVELGRRQYKFLNSTGRGKFHSSPYS